MNVNKFKGIIMTIFIIGVIITFIVVCNSNVNKRSKEYKTINDIVDVALNSTGNVMVYIGGSDCNECAMQSYQMRLFLSDYDLEYYYINLDGISKSDRDDVLSKLELDKNIKFPTIAIYQNGDLIVSQSGLVGTNSMYNLFKNHNLITPNPLKLNYLTLTQYIEKVETGSFVLAVGSMKSEESIQFEEVLWQISEENNIDISFIYVSNLTKLEGELFESKLKNFDDFNVSIPSLLLVSNGNIENGLTGLFDKENYVEFLKENGIIK